MGTVRSSSQIDHCRSFPYSAAKNAHALILGSMPGQRSLECGQYYAHPQNCFWDIMGGIFGAGRHIAYKKRLELLKRHRVALWDVARRCLRRGSMDSDIRTETVVPNDIKGFLDSHPHIRTIFFNGQKAEELFMKLVMKGLSHDIMKRLKLIRLPSTSPAYAALSRKDKKAHWKKDLAIAE